MLLPLSLRLVLATAPSSYDRGFTDGAPELRGDVSRGDSHADPKRAPETVPSGTPEPSPWFPQTRLVVFPPERVAEQLVVFFLTKMCVNPRPI